MNEFVHGPLFNPHRGITHRADGSYELDEMMSDWADAGVRLAL